MLKERAIFRNSNGVDQLWRDVVEANHAPLRTFTTGDRTDEFRFQLGFVEMRAVQLVRQIGNRFPPTSKIDTELCEPHAVDDRIRTRIDLDSLAGDAVAAASTVCLLITLNIAGSLQITNQIVLSNVLTGADGLGGRVNTCRAREDLAAEQVVNARGKDDPVVDQNRNCG